MRYGAERINGQRGPVRINSSGLPDRGSDGRKMGRNKETPARLCLAGRDRCFLAAPLEACAIERSDFARL
jgi:hypothetical protein